MPALHLPISEKFGQLEVKKSSSRDIGPKELEQIVALCRGGWYLEEIASATGRTRKQIENALWNEDWVPRAHKYQRDEVSKWVSMYQGSDGSHPMSFAAIARETGYCAGTIQLAVLRSGVRDRHPAESRRLAAEWRKANQGH